MVDSIHQAHELPVFDRKFWDGKFRFTRIGRGSIGGKASGLAFMRDILERDLKTKCPESVEISVPTMAVISTDSFDAFIRQNRLDELPFDDMPDQRIGMAFQRADMPVELLGDLRSLVDQVTTPLAIRSSSLLEDALERPFAGVYATKMIPNNQFDADTRFRRLVEAIKFVYASTFFREAREYIRTTGCNPRDEKMAIIIQEVVGRRHADRFYPDISGVARSFNFYPIAPAKPENGVVSLALGLGKTIVDGGISWTYSPRFPKSPPPFASLSELMDNTQTRFWAVNMGKVLFYDPVNEVECMLQGDLKQAETDEVLQFVSSTYDPERGRLTPGTWSRGPRVLNFAPVLVLEQFPVNAAIRMLLEAAEQAMSAKVEIEFAITLDTPRNEAPRMRIGFLQVRPMVVVEDSVEVTAEHMHDSQALVASDRVMGNGTWETIHDIVYVRPENFSVEQTPLAAEQIAQINRALVRGGKNCVLIGFGRWGSSHSSLGIPVDWSQISSARVIVEATLPGMNVELSQGSHFFHNLSSFKACYFMVHHEGQFEIDWDWLNQQEPVSETNLVRHVRTDVPLQVRVDGRSARGVIMRSQQARNG